MRKQEYLDALRSGLSGLPQEDIETSVEFYAEAIDDRMEGGLSEEEAVAEMGSIQEIAAQILSETSLPKLIKARVTPHRALGVWQTILIVLGAPVWIPLLLAAAICVLAGFIVIWSVVFSLYAVDLSLAASAIAGVAGLVQCLVSGNLLAGGISLGVGMVCAGMALLLFLGLGRVSKAGLRLSKRFLLWIKSLFLRKENP